LVFSWGLKVFKTGDLKSYFSNTGSVYQIPVPSRKHQPEIYAGWDVDSGY